MKKINLIKVRSVSDFHKLRGLQNPEHPLISIVDYAKMTYADKEKNGLIFDFYTISVKRNVSGKFRYGQQKYDFNEGVMFFTAPNQTFRFEAEPGTMTKISGWVLLIHPDFLWKTSLAKNIKQFNFFDYAANEALFLSQKEEQLIEGIIQNIRQEYHSNIDKFSKQIIITHLENLLSYAERFYNRQFITREKANHQILERLEKLLNDYFDSDNLISKGLPTVQYISDNLNISSTYLLSLLKTLTGQTTQQHIHGKLIEKAKEKLSATDLSVSEIAYELGFEHLQSFSKLFKTKTKLSPMKFRQSFN